MPSSLWEAPLLKSLRNATLPFHWNGLTINSGPAIGFSTDGKKSTPRTPPVSKVTWQGSLPWMWVAVNEPKAIPFAARATVCVPPRVHVSVTRRC
jgi:hypothetical protein